MNGSEFIPTAEVKTEHIVRAINELRDMITEVDIEVHETIHRVDDLAPLVKKAASVGTNKLLLASVLVGGVYIGWKMAKGVNADKIVDAVVEAIKDAKDGGATPPKDDAKVTVEADVDGHPS